MDTAVLDAPVLDAPAAAAAAAVTPRTPAEAALCSAWAIASDQAVQAAEQLASAAEAALDRQEVELATAGRVAELRNLLLARQGLGAMHHYLAALGNGEVPEPLPKTPDVDADLVRCYIRSDPNRYARLLARAESMANTAAVNGEKAGARLNVCREEYAAGVLDLPGFVTETSRLLTEQAQHKARAERFRSAISAARSALRRGAESLGLTALEIGLREAVDLKSRQSSRQPDPEISRLSAALEAIDGDLTAVGLGIDDEAESGPITASLKAQRADYAEQLQSRKRELAASRGASVSELVDRARNGDPEALAKIAGVVCDRRLVFRARLDSDLVDALADSLADSSPDVWAELVMT